MPLVCPECGSVLVKRGAHHFCPNHECPAQIKGRLSFFCAKEQMDIEGLGPKTVEFLFDNGFVKRLEDFYTFNYDTLLSYEGFGSEGKKVSIIKRGLKESKKVPFRRVLVSLGVPEFGKKAAELVIKAGYDNIDKIFALSNNEDFEALANIKGLGSVMAKLIVDGFKNQDLRKTIESLRALGLQMDEKLGTGILGENGEVLGTALPQIFEGQSWCVTGTFEHFIPRSKAMDEIKKRGGTEVSAISSKTTCLLVGQGAGSKLAKAKALGVRIITEETFLELLNSASYALQEEPNTIEKKQQEIQPALFE